MGVYWPVWTNGMRCKGSMWEIHVAGPMSRTRCPSQAAHGTWYLKATFPSPILVNENPPGVKWHLSKTGWTGWPGRKPPGLKLMRACSRRGFLSFSKTNWSPDLTVGCCAFRKDQELLPGFSGCRITPGSMIYKNEWGADAFTFVGFLLCTLPCCPSPLCSQILPAQCISILHREVQNFKPEQTQCTCQ